MKNISAFLKSAFVIFILILINASCNKKTSSDDTNYHLTCDIDGSPMSFNFNNVAHITYSGGYKSVELGGFNSSGTASVGFIIINQPAKDSITTGTYVDTTPRFEILASYIPNFSTDGFDAGTEIYKSFLSSGHTIVNHFTVTISSLTTESIRGTFSGDFYADFNPTGPKKSITNGDFYLKFQ